MSYTKFPKKKFDPVALCQASVTITTYDSLNDYMTEYGQSLDSYCLEYYISINGYITREAHQQLITIMDIQEACYTMMRFYEMCEEQFQNSSDEDLEDFIESILRSGRDDDGY